MNGDIGVEVVAEALETVLSRVDYSLVSRSAAHHIEKILNSTVLHRGKRFRPTLLVLFGRFLGLKAESLIPYARAAEMAHAATLAHDDVIDEAKERRNSRTLNAVSSNAHAVLGGDFLLARVITELSTHGERQLIRNMAEVIEKLVSGEWMQLEARGIIDITHEHLSHVAENKTASLMSWCCTTPAHLAQAGSAVKKLSLDFGNRVGVAFQQIDDILDFEEESGKRPGQDFHEGLINFVACEHLKLFPERRAEILATLGKPDAWPWNEAELSQAKEVVRASALAQLAEAAQLLDQIAKECLAQGIQVDARAQSGLLRVLSGIAQRKQ